jgi:hypothetical protein
MHQDETHDHVVVSVEPGSDMTEELAVTAVADGTYRLVEPPALTTGLAKGDVFAIDAATLRPSVLRRSGNLTLCLYSETATDDPRPLVGEVESVGGTFDGAAPGGRLFIFTLPVGATFPVIEEIFDHYIAEHPASVWYFGNVYAEDGVTPLEWW